MSTRIALLLLMATAAAPAMAQVDQMMPPIGGQGGGHFTARCTEGEILNGFELRVGDDVDGLRAICARATSPTSIAPRTLHATSVGGAGGRVVQVACPDEAPAVVRLMVGWEGVQTYIVNNIRLFCGSAAVNQVPAAYPTVAFDGIAASTGSGFGSSFKMALTFDQQDCAPGLVPVGINGRSGKWLDAVGLVCGALRLDLSGYPKPTAPAAPKLTASSGQPFSIRIEWRRPAPANYIEWYSVDQWKNQAWVKLSKRVDPETFQTHIDYPDVTDPGERQAFRVCAENIGHRACSRETWYYTFGKTEATLANGATVAQARAAATPPPTLPPAPTAPAPVTAADLQSVMARGALLAEGDPLAAELRRRLTDDLQRRGFDTGMGIWAGNTAPGPGKQRYRDALPPNAHFGFDTAATFSLPRNKYAVQSQVGAAIMKADRQVARARTAENDPFFLLGFDIASGIFGDRRAGAQGNTATGPGSLAIRNELNAAGRRGFDAATALHLGRKYN